MALLCPAPLATPRGGRALRSRGAFQSNLRMCTAQPENDQHEAVYRAKISIWIFSVAALVGASCSLLADVAIVLFLRFQYNEGSLVMTKPSITRADSERVVRLVTLCRYCLMTI